MQAQKGGIPQKEENHHLWTWQHKKKTTQEVGRGSATFFMLDHTQNGRHLPSWPVDRPVPPVSWQNPRHRGTPRPLSGPEGMTKGTALIINS